MSILEMLFVSIGLSLDVFAYALYKGSLLSHLEKKGICKMAVIFTLWQMAAMFLGCFITKITWINPHYFEIRNGWKLISAVIFLVLGIYMLMKSKHFQPILERKQDEFPIKKIVIWASVTGVDALFAGIGMGLLETKQNENLLVFGIVTLLAVLGGVFAGYRLGCGRKAHKKAVIIGGCMLLLVGIDVIFLHIL